MKLKYDIKETADWHYDSQMVPTDELRKVAHYDISAYDGVVANILADPYMMGGIKRIHIGSPALKVNNKQINVRSLYMEQIGYSHEDYFIEFNNDVLQNLVHELRVKFNLIHEHYCIIVIPPGQCMPVHGDTYSYLMRYMERDNPEVQYDLKEHCRRYLTFLSDWEWGQSLGAGNVLKWQKGDIFEWEHKLIHWSSNAGLKPMVFLEVTGLRL